MHIICRLADYTATHVVHNLEESIAVHTSSLTCAGDEEVAKSSYVSPIAPSNRQGTVEFSLSYSATGDSPDGHSEDTDEGAYSLVSEDKCESGVEVVSQTVVTVQQ